MIGDAFAFLDPVFSTGVLLAMTAGELGAEVADDWLDDPARGRELAKRMERDLADAMARISWMIYRINTPALRIAVHGARQHAADARWDHQHAGRQSARQRDQILPVLALKAAYYFVSLAQRLGLPTGRRGPATVAAE